jgi:hypothetical protein
MHMKKFIVLTVVAIASQAVAIFAGEPIASKQVVAPPPPPPPEFFRPNEFDIGAFATYATGVGSRENAGKLHAWGEAWISVTGFHGNMRVSGSKGPE